MAPGDVAFRFTVAGKVQGVFFRASAARQAARLGVSGHAINLPDGRVEVLAVGAAGAVEEMRRWLHRGPPVARVDSVQALELQVAAAGAVHGFRTG